MAVRLPGSYHISPWPHAAVQVYEYRHKLYPVAQMTFALRASPTARSVHRRSQSGLDRVQSDADQSLGVYHVRKDQTKRPDAIILCIDNELVLNARSDHPNELIRMLEAGYIV